MASTLGIIAGSQLVAGDLVGGTRRRDVVVAEGPVTVLEGDGLVVLARHGIDEFVPAHRVDHHRNVRALAAAGCDRVVAMASVGGLRPDWPLGTVVVPDDWFAPWAAPTFHEGYEGHRVPGFHGPWRAAVVAAWRVGQPDAVDGGVYVQMGGPRFETPAEVRFLATVGDVVGMTVASEAHLCSELDLPYAAVCSVDNLANGLDVTGLTVEAFHAGSADGRAVLGAGLAASLDALPRRQLVTAP